ncbi:RPN5 [Ecytonucleospora hepatopenaei]|uniref:RPN5 n=1 Tax=Ecytonucleospora hepatopenaei TaxID=646526 RepID=A0A1W0E895_9MICR|nr:RPN5 [Ecytonucleospora hepatopenaei]
MTNSNNLFELERIARTNNDSNLLEIQEKIINTCSDFTEIVATLKVLQNKRRQNMLNFKTILNKVIECRYDTLAPILNTDAYIKMLDDILNIIVSGKIYLEQERIKIAEIILTYISQSKDEQKLEKMHKVISDVPVETFINVDDKKKNELLFSSFSFAYLLGKFDECEMILRRIVRSGMEDEDKYVLYMYEAMLSVCFKNYKEAASKYLLVSELSKSSKICVSMKKYVVLGSYYMILNNLQLKNRKINTNLEINSKLQTGDISYRSFYVHSHNDEVMRNILYEFINNNIINYSSMFAKLSKVMSCYENDTLINSNKYVSSAGYAKKHASSSFQENVVNDENILRNAVNEHNLFVCVKFFSAVHVSQLAFLMQMDENTTIEFLSFMVNNGYVNIRINQQTNIIKICENKNYNNNVNKVLDGIKNVAHVIESYEL